MSVLEAALRPEPPSTVRAGFREPVSRFPGSRHVKALGLSAADDRAIWDYAGVNGFAIISKDGDFQQLSFLYGTPPKVIWLKTGNCTVANLQDFIFHHSDEIIAFEAEAEAAVLILS